MLIKTCVLEVKRKFGIRLLNVESLTVAIASDVVVMVLACCLMIHANVFVSFNTGLFFQLIVGFVIILNAFCHPVEPVTLVCLAWRVITLLEHAWAVSVIVSKMAAVELKPQEKCEGKAVLFASSFLCLWFSAFTSQKMLEFVY